MIPSSTSIVIPSEARTTATATAPSTSLVFTTFHLPIIPYNPSSSDNIAVVLSKLLLFCSVGVLLSKKWIWGCSDYGAMDESQTRQRADGGNGIQMRYFQGVSHESWSYLKCVLYLLDYYGYSKLVNIHTWVSPAAYALFIGGKNFRKSTAGMIYYLRPLLTQYFIENFWLKSEPEFPSDIDAMLTYFKEHEDINVREHAIFVFDVLNALGTHLSGIRLADFSMYNAGRKYLLPFMATVDHDNYVKSGLLSILRYEHQVKEKEIFDWYKKLLFVGKPGQTEGFDFQIGEAVVKTMKGDIRSHHEKSIEKAAVMSDVADVKESTLFKNVGLSERTSEMHPAPDLSRDMAAGLKWLRDKQPYQSNSENSSSGSASSSSSSSSSSTKFIKEMTSGRAIQNNVGFSDLLLEGKDIIRKYVEDGCESICHGKLLASTKVRADYIKALTNTGL